MILKNDGRPHFCGECRGTISLLVEVSHDEAILCLSRRSNTLPRRERPLLAGKGTMIVFEHWFTYTTPLNFTRFKGIIKALSGMCVRLTSITFPVIWSSTVGWSRFSE